MEPREFDERVDLLKASAHGRRTQVLRALGVAEEVLNRKLVEERADLMRQNSAELFLPRRADDLSETGENRCVPLHFGIQPEEPPATLSPDSVRRLAMARHLMPATPSDRALHCAAGNPQGTIMQENPMQAAMQPFLKLAQSNMDLMMKFSMSPGQASATTLYGASAFAELMQGMLKNYTEFMTEFAQSGMAVLAQGRAAMARQAEEFGANVLDAEEARGRRNKKGS